MQRYTQIQFKAPANIGAIIMSEVFGSLPTAEESLAYCSLAAAKLYCAAYQRLHEGGSGYHVPTVTVKEGVVTFITPASNREISYWPETDLWTVDFGPKGSEMAASQILNQMQGMNGMQAEELWHLVKVPKKPAA